MREGHAETKLRGRRGWLSAAVALALAGPFAGAARAAETHTLDRIDDLRPLLARVRRERIPLLLFFSTPGCPYCIEVRRSYLVPRVRDPRAGVLIREVDIVGQRSFIDRDGQRVTEARFAAQFGVRVVPVVLLVDADLTPLAEPLVGLDGAGFYDAYLGNAIESATGKLRAR
jgi:thioredoxin-related protein